MRVPSNFLYTILTCLLIRDVSSFGIVTPKRTTSVGRAAVVSTTTTRLPTASSSFLPKKSRPNNWQLGFKPDDSELEFAEYSKDDNDEKHDDKIERMAAFLSIRLGKSVIKEQLKKNRDKKQDIDKDSDDKDDTTAEDKKPPIILPPVGTDAKDSPKASDGPEATEKETQSKTSTATKDVPADVLQELEKTIEDVSQAQEKAKPAWQASGVAAAEKLSSGVSDEDLPPTATTTDADKTGADDTDKKSKDWDWKEVLEKAKQAPTKSEDSGSDETKPFKKTYDDVAASSKSKHSKAEKLKGTSEVMKEKLPKVSVGEDETQDHDVERPSLMHKKEGDRNLALKDEFDGDDNAEPEEAPKEAELLDPTLTSDAASPATKTTEVAKESGIRTNVDLPKTPPVVSTAFGKPLPTEQEGLPPLRDESNPAKSTKKQTKPMSTAGQARGSGDSKSLKAHAVAMDVARPAAQSESPGNKSPSQKEPSVTEKSSGDMTLQERASKILFDLGLAEVHPNPSDPDYDHSQDDEFCPENRRKDLS